MRGEYYPNIAELSEDEVAKQAPFGAKWRLLAQVEVRCYILISNMKEFSEPAVDAKASYSFVASFAWSAYSCLIGGYPQNSPSECLTLSEACAEDGVSVMIQTSEPGICFEEHITCDDTGTVEHTEKDLLAYKCRHCGEITSFASFEDPDDQECPECGNCGFDRCEEV